MSLRVKHRLDHTPIYVNPGDSAWDHDKIDSELRLIRIARGEEQADEGEELPAIPWTSEDEHPVKLYAGGASRYDLDTVREYLIADNRPTEFVLRRLSAADYADVKDELAQNRVGRARLMAIERGLVEIRGLDEWKPRRNKATGFLRRDSIEDLRELLEDLDFDLLGYACITASASLQDAEKKR